MTLEGSGNGKERRMNKPLSSGAHRMIEARERGDLAAIKAMKAKAARTRAENALNPKPKPKSPAQLKIIAAERLKEMIALDTEARRADDALHALRERAERGEIRFVGDPADGIVETLYEPPED